MKTFLIVFLWLVSVVAQAASDTPREIVIHTESVGGKVHWLPNPIPVTPGEKVKFVVKHELEGGFNFHGFSIPALKIAKQVDRKTDLVVEATVPATLKPGEYDVNCQFHPAHVGTKLLVKAPATASPAASPAASAAPTKTP